LQAYDGVLVELGLKTTNEKERAAGLILRLAQGQVNLEGGNYAIARQTLC